MSVSKNNSRKAAKTNKLMLEEIIDALRNVEAGQKEIHEKIETLSGKLELLEDHVVSSSDNVDKQIEKIKILVKGLDDSARLILMTSMMKELQELTKGKADV